MSEDELKDKILPGYCYEIGDSEEKIAMPGQRNIIAQTGEDGAKLFVDTCRKEGLSDEIIGSIIFCHTEMGKLPLSVLTVKEIDNGQ